LAPGDFAREPFPRAEYASRLERARAALAERGMSAMVLTSQRNFEYFTGYRTPAWFIKSRPLIAVVPASGPLFVVASEAHATEIEAEGLVETLVAYTGFEPTATEALVQGLDQHGLRHETLGFELGHEQRLGIPAREFQRLCSALEGSRITDAADVIWRLRMTKSVREIAYLREAGRITGEAYARLLPRLQAGWTLADVYREFGEALLDLGSDGAEYLTMTGGPGHYELHNSWPGERALVAGELFWMDVAAPYRAYFADYTRCASVGLAQQVQVETYRRVHDILDRALDAVHGGVEVGTIMAAAQASAAEHGLTITVSSRIGHGVGLDLTEPPSISHGGREVLLPGMVIAVEPGVVTDHGFYHLEENVVVLRDGFAFLSEPMPACLPEAGR
jgi:Xaa-Pro aminopeptidase